MRPHHVTAIAAGLGGLVLGFLVGATLGGGLGQSAADRSADGTTTTRPGPPPTRTLGAQAPALQGLTLVVARSSAPGTEAATVLETWQSDWHTPSPRPTPASLHAVRWNADRTRLAGLAIDQVRPVLYVGRGDSLEPAALAVHSFAWHATDPDVLTYLDMEGSLWRWSLDDVPVAVGLRQGPGSRLHLAGDWGYALTHGDTVDVLQPNGAVKDGASGYATTGHDAAGSGLPVVVFGSPEAPSALLDPVTGRRLDWSQPVIHAAVSEDGVEYAVLLAGGLGVLLLQVWTVDGELVFEDTVPAGRIVEWQGDVILMIRNTAQLADDESGLVQQLDVVDVANGAVSSVDLASGFVAGTALLERT